MTLEGSLRSDVAVAATGSDPARGTPDPDRLLQRVRHLERNVVRLPRAAPARSPLVRRPLAARETPGERIKQVSAAVAEVVGGGS